jgi:hypothetical protein
MMDGILRHDNKKVQDGLYQFVERFGKYQDRNLYILYEGI